MSQLFVPTKGCRNTGIYLDYLSPCQPISDVKNLIFSSHILDGQGSYSVLPQFTGYTCRKVECGEFPNVDTFINKFRLNAPSILKSSRKIIILILLNWNFSISKFGRIVFLAAIAVLYLSSSLTHSVTDISKRTKNQTFWFILILSAIFKI